MISLFVVGDRVQICIAAVVINGMHESKEQAERFDYILDHPDEIYKIKSISSPVAIAQISLDHDVLGPTSFFEEELIKVKEDKII